MRAVASENDMRPEQIAIGPVEVPSNSWVNIEVISEKGPFIAHNMVVTEADAPHFFITDIKVGKNSQFVTAHAVHASFFARRGMIDDLLFDALPRGMRMSVCVLNICSASKIFSAVFRGELYDDGPQARVPLRKERSDKIVMGLGHTIVPAKSTSKINIQAQLVCKPDLIVIPPYVLDGVKLKAVRVVGNDVLSTELQDGEATLKVARMQISDWLCVEVENQADQPKAFYGAIGGRLER